MTKIVIATVIGAVAAAVGGVALATGSGGADAKPVLRLADATPLTVRGLHFEANERVSVTVRVQEGRSLERGSRTLTAGSGGGFVARFPGIDANACSGYGVTAVGNDGSRATLARKPGVCPPPPPSEG